MEFTLRTEDLAQVVMLVAIAVGILAAFIVIALQYVTFFTVAWRVMQQPPTDRKTQRWRLAKRASKHGFVVIVAFSYYLAFTKYDMPLNFDFAVTVGGAMAFYTVWAFLELRKNLRVFKELQPADGYYDHGRAHSPRGSSRRRGTHLREVPAKAS